MKSEQKPDEIWKKLVVMTLYAELSDEENFTPMTLEQFLGSGENPFPGVLVDNTQAIELYRAGYRIAMADPANVDAVIEAENLLYGEVITFMGKSQYVWLYRQEVWQLQSETELWTRIFIDLEWAERMEVVGERMIFSRGSERIIYDFATEQIHEAIRYGKWISFAGVPIQPSACFNLVRGVGVMHEGVKS